MRRAAPQQWSVTALLSGLLAIPPLSTDISLPALPSIAGAFSEDVSRAQLVVALFLVGFAVGQLGYGPASDRFGRRPVLIGSLGLYFVAGVGCLVAPSLEWLGAARLLQGLGACGGPVIARAVVRDVYEPVRGAPGAGTRFPGDGRGATRRCHRRRGHRPRVPLAWRL